jgi:CSLREA domain-containing protein
MNKKILIILLTVFFCLGLTFTAKSATFTVNNNGDTDDSNTTDNLCLDSSGNCTLRAAIQQANETAGNDTINFSLTTPATITLTINDRIMVDSAMADTVTINGPSPRLLTIDRASNVDFGTFELLSGTLNISGVKFINNNQTVLTNVFGTVSLNQTDFTNNLGSCVVSFDVAVSMSVANSLFNNNGTDTNTPGSAIENRTPLTVTNSTFINNKASNGGALNNQMGGVAVLTNVTVTGNQSSDGGGLINFEPAAAVKLRNSLVAGNTATSPSSGYDLSGSFTSLGNNLIGDNRNSNGFTHGVNSDKVGTQAAPLNALLSSLANNGGPTNTVSLLSGSPAYNSGNNCVTSLTCASDNPPQVLTSDQRGTGFGRMQGGIVDIGAYESVLTAAGVNISGRVLNSRGRGINNVRLSLTSTNGETRYTQTNVFGYYQFQDITVGEVYIVSVAAKRFTFAVNSQVIYVTDEISDLNFMAQ